MKKYILTIFLILGLVFPVYAQEGEEVPPEEEAAEEVEEPAAEEVEEAAPSGGGGSSDFMFSLGLLYALSVQETEQTNASEESPLLPRLSAQLFFDGWLAELELIGNPIMNAGFKVNGKGGISTGSIADSELQFSGYMYTFLFKFDDDFLQYYGGYGMNQFEVSQSLSSKINQKADRSGVVFEQDLDTKGGGSQVVLGIDMVLSEEVYLHSNLRWVTIPLSLSSSIRSKDSYEPISASKEFDLTFTILSIGASYYF